MHRHVKSKKPVLFILTFAFFILLIILLMQPLEIHFGGDIALLFPKGSVAIKQRNLLLIIQAIMLLVVIPVYVLTFIFSWKYRAHNHKANYRPDWNESRIAEYIWWGIPFVIIVFISIFTWIETYRLDPFRPLASDKKPMTIQVVALQWKWLFIYPEQQIATVNFVQFPEKTPIKFEITADAPMNSFWIPQLGGQIYAMPKMKTELNLIADEMGEFRGSSANISGDGFAGMHFIAKASSDEEFIEWVQGVKQSGTQIDWDSYTHLALPSQNNPVSVYSLADEDLFEKVVMKFMNPPTKHE